MRAISICKVFVDLCLANEGDKGLNYQPCNEDSL
jgi:hypothetical protein